MARRACPAKSPISNRCRRASPATPSSNPRSRSAAASAARCASIAASSTPAVIRPVAGEWQPRMPRQLDEQELADWRAGRNAVYQLAALTIGARLAVADA
jgi:hypothetical protein